MQNPPNTLLILSGASGFVGRELVPLLRAKGHMLLLVGRDASRLRELFPDHACCTYAELPEQRIAGATMIHLAARNNDRPGSLADFRQGNVAQLLETATVARDHGVRRFINLSSTHALEPRPDDAYGVSKAEGAAALEDFWPEGGVTLYVPAIYGRRFAGRLAVLNGAPAPLRALSRSILSSLKPMLGIERLADGLLALVRQPESRFADTWSRQRFLADPAAWPYRFVMRTADISAALLLGILLLPVMVAVALWVRLDSAGPAIFAQERVGQGGRVFTCYKFRTMARGTVQAATHEVSQSTVTRAGAFLRRTKLDELPQLLNILAGQMALVGPRPCLPVQEELTSARRQLGVLEVLPGITGLAQVRDVDMSIPSRLAALDARYRAFRTLPLDLKLLIQTVTGKGQGDRVAVGPTAS